MFFLKKKNIEILNFHSPIVSTSQREWGNGDINRFLTERERERMKKNGFTYEAKYSIIAAMVLPSIELSSNT